MKRIALIMILGVYTILSVGVQLHLHYCCGHLSDFHFIPIEHCDHHETSEHSEPCCEKENCCAFLHIDLKVHDSHQPSETASFIPFEAVDSFPISSPRDIAEFPSHSVAANLDFSPPDNRRYLLFHSLVLYA